MANNIAHFKKVQQRCTQQAWAYLSNVFKAFGCGNYQNPWRLWDSLSHWFKIVFELLQPELFGAQCKGSNQVKVAKHIHVSSNNIWFLSDVTERMDNSVWQKSAWFLWKEQVRTRTSFMDCWQKPNHLMDQCFVTASCSRPLPIELIKQGLSGELLV